MPFASRDGTNETVPEFNARKDVGAMRVVTIIAAIIVVALLALTMVPQTAVYSPQLTIGALAAAVMVFLFATFGRDKSPTPAPVVAEAARPVAPPPPPANQIVKPAALCCRP